MTAGPTSPGTGAPVNQPAGKPPGGTSNDPSSSSPRDINCESTPIAGTCNRTGGDSGAALADGAADEVGAAEVVAPATCGPAALHPASRRSSATGAARRITP